jgi:ADP-heptose:LPS heptosyltransferase
MALTIYDRRERALVGLADALLFPVSLRRLVRRQLTHAPARILCLRLERIGDLLMTLPALAELRALAPQASIDLVAGSWNREIAEAIAGVSRVETVDAEWLTRGDGAGLSALAIARRAAAWRKHRYDLAINFEPDIRTNLALAASGAVRTAGFRSGGGGPLLDIAIEYDTSAHTADNALALVRAVFGGGAATTDPASASLQIPESARAEAARLIAPLGDGVRIGIHVSGGREVKQWPVPRFCEVAERLVRDRSAGIVLTGTPADRALVDAVRTALPAERVVDLSSGPDLLTVAAVIQQLHLFVTGDTGPMHLAHAVGTPIVAVFGPSDPKRYAPRGVRDTVVRIDLPCSPCNRIRLPPERCIGHTPDCLAGIEVSQVLAAVDDALRDAKR